MVKPVVVAAALLAVPVLALSACSPEQKPSNEPGNPPGTLPPVWTGSPAPGASPTEGQPAGQSEQLKAELKSRDGKVVGTATIDFADGFATVTVETTSNDVLKPGFHGLHIHQVGECVGDFKSAGGHLQVPASRTEHPASGDLTSLQVRPGGSAELVTTTAAFTRDDLLAGRKTAIIIHEKADNFTNIPERYNPGDGAPFPDQTTLDTGDAGDRVACGVIGTG